MLKYGMYFLFFFCALFVGAQNKVVIVTQGFDHPMALVAAKILPEAYEKLGYQVEFLTLPPNRANVVFDEGTVDGFLFSDKSFAAERKGAIQVTSSIGSDDMVVFTKKSNLNIQGWESLKPYVVGYQIGMVIIKEKVKSLALKGEPSQTPPQAFQKLDAGRSDVVVMPLGVGLMMIKNLKLKGIIFVQPPLEAVPLYCFLTSKNAELASKLSAVLADMKKSGRLKEVTDQVMANY